MSSHSPLLRAPQALPRLARLGGLLAALLLAPVALAEDEIPPGEADSEASADAEEPEGEGEATAEQEVEPAEPAEGEAEPAEEDLEGAGEIAIPRPPTAGMEEIVITGELLEGVVEDKTVSVIGFDQNVLKLEGIKDIRDLSNFTPTLEIKSAFAASNPTIFIRGVGLDDFNANAATAVAVYQDGVYMQSPVGQLFQFFDTENAVVLRGPQPSLYRSASAGAILVESKKPTDELDAYMSATYGNYDLVEVEGAVGGPIGSSEQLSGRLSGLWTIRDGITENRCGPTSNIPDPASPEIPDQCDEPRNNGERFVSPGLDDWTNNLDAWASRGQLLFKLPVGENEMEWLLNVHGGQNRSRALQFQHRGVVFLPFCGGGLTPPDCVEDETLFIPDFSNPPFTDDDGYHDDDGDPFAGDYDIDGPEDISLAGASLRGSWLFGDGYQLESLTAYEWHERFTLENSDANPVFTLKDEYEDTAWQLSQQLDLRGNWSESDAGSGTWVLGVYYLQEDLDVSNFFDVSQGQRLLQDYTQETRNFASYAQTEYHILPGCSPIPCDFTLTAGLRYNLEYKSFDTVVDTLQGGQTLEGSNDSLWDGLGAEVSLAWNFSEASSLYAKFSEGWKGGHFNGGAVTQFDIITSVRPEIVDSYEGGLRSLWFDDRLMLNATGFYYDYQDLQVFQLEQTPNGFPIPKLVNANDAIVYGVELDAGATPLPGLNLTYNFAWVESEYVDFVVMLPERIRPEKPPGGGPRPPVITRKTYDYSGNPLIASPRFSMTGSVEYTAPIPGTLFDRGLGSLTPRFSFSWKDETFFDACSGRGARCNFPTAFFGQPAFWVFNAALTWRSEDERLELTGWVHNFLDEHYKTQNFDLSREFQLILDAYAEPRTFGLTATLSF